MTVFVPPGKFLWLMWGGVAVLAFYSASMGALGAMFNQVQKGPKVEEAAQ